MEETMAGCQRLAFKDIHNFIMSLVGEDLHAKRVYSLANATQGIITSASLAVSTIGQGLAAARGLLSKHAIKQVDRLLSNAGIEVDAFFVRWVPYIVGERKSIEVAMDWTDFDADKQATIMLSLITQHGRTTSLVWLTVDKDLSLIHISEPTRLGMISYAVFCLKKKKTDQSSPSSSRCAQS